MHHHALVCWKCGASLKSVSLPITRRDECPVCHTELHVCRMCRHFDPHITGQCGHDYADPPRERERANFCDYFKLLKKAFRPIEKSKSMVAKAELAALFGDAEKGEGQPETNIGRKSAYDESQAAKQELERLFSKGDE